MGYLFRSRDDCAVPVLRLHAAACSSTGTHVRTGWRPKGIALLCASAVYAGNGLAHGEVAPSDSPVRVGNVALDTGFSDPTVVVSMLLGPMMSLTARFSNDRGA